jgi:serine/threonine protein kinase
MMESNLHTQKEGLVGKIIRDYKIVDYMGGGGMAELYLARRSDGMLKRTAVIKIVGAHLPEEGRLRFIGEMQAQESLNHPNIAQVYDAGQLEDGRPFMIIEYVDGQSLREMLIDQKSVERLPVALPLEVVAEITEQACAGLSEAHRKKIVHRDIKPENIIVNHDGDKYKVKIIDFGIALPQASGMLPTRTPTAGIIGTPEYISPEQVMPTKYYLDEPGERPGYSADIYALGVVIYEMLTGKRPFSGYGYEVALKHTWEIPVAPSIVRPELNLPESVDRVVMKALAKQPAERHKSVELLARELKAAIKTSREMEVLTTQIVILKPTQNQEPEPRAQIASKFPKTAYARVLPGILLIGVGLLTFLLYFKPWERNPGPTTGAGAGIPVNSLTTSIPISKMKVSLIRQDKRGNEEGVSPETTFYNGDSVRIRIQADQSGFLYIMSRGSSGKLSMLYPNRRIQGGNNQIVKGKVISIPTDGDWITFDKNPGTETLYLLFAENKTEKFIAEIENATSQAKISLPTELEGKAVDLVTTGGDLKGQGILIGALKLRHQP